MNKKINKNNLLVFNHYLYIIVSIIIIIIIIWYFYSWRVVIKKEMLSKSYLVSSNTISLELKDGKEALSVLQETPSNYFVFISYTGNEKVYNLEKKLKKIIDNYNIADTFYYLDMTESIKSNSLMSYLNKSFNTDLISSIPCILYYKDGKLDTVIQNATEIFDANELKELLEKSE